MENQGLFIGVAHFLKGFLTVTIVTGDFVETKENLSRPSREAESGRRAEVRSRGRRGKVFWTTGLGPGAGGQPSTSSPGRSQRGL